MLKELIDQPEGRELEFKENTKSLQKIVQTIVAFANTAGGTLVVGVKDKTKEIVGLDDALRDEERLARAVADSVSPQLVPLFQLYTLENKDLIIITVSHAFGPYYIKTKGLSDGVFIRMGSTNRIADREAVARIQQLRVNKNFDEQPNFDCSVSAIDLEMAKRLFVNVSKKFTGHIARSLDLIVREQGAERPTNGAVLLFAKDVADYFPDACIRLVRFLGVDRTETLDHHDLCVPLAGALDPILAFVRRNTRVASRIGEMRRIETPEYPKEAVREAITNALVHTDYSIKGASIHVCIFEDRIEITNPGVLPFGLTMEAAFSGVSQLRNRVIGRVFRELALIEQWGSGFLRMRDACEEHGAPAPKIEELGTFFRVTLYRATGKRARKSAEGAVDEWQQSVLDYLHEHETMEPKRAQKIWKVTARTTSTRLKKMRDAGLLVEVSTGPFDPHKVLRLP